MKKIISGILTAALVGGMLAAGSLAAPDDAALKFDDTVLTEGGGSHGYAVFDAKELLEGEGVTFRMDFTMGHSAPCIHPKDPLAKHSSKLNFTIGASGGTYKYFGYNATEDFFYLAVSSITPNSGEGTSGYTYLAKSESGLVRPGVTYDLVFQTYYDTGFSVYLDGECVLEFDLYNDLTYPDYFSYSMILMYPTHINCYIDNMALYSSAVYNPATGDGADDYYDFTDFSDAVQHEDEVKDDDGNVTGVNKYVTVSEWSFSSEAYSLVTVSDEIYGQPQYECAEGQPNVIFQNDVESSSTMDFDVDLTIKNNPGLDSLELDLLSDPYITVKSVAAADGLTAVLGETDAKGVTKLTVTGSGYTGEKLATITYTMSESAVQKFVYGYGAKTDTMKLTGAEGIENAVLTNGITEVFNYTVGDLNRDGKFNISDVAIILKMAAKWTLPGVFTEAGDVNGDGRTNTMDASYYLKWLAHWKGYVINGIYY